MAMCIDTVDADSKPGELLVKYSRRPEMASVFNYASMAHNNHFFFNCLVSRNAFSSSRIS